MVDLVKIRKKAKRQETPAPSLEAGPAAGEVSVAPAATGEPAPPRKPAALSPASPAPPAASLPSPASSKLDRFKELAGKRREGFVREAASSDEAGRIEVLTFAIAGELYAAGIERVAEIIPVRDVTRVPNAESSVIGIISLRGTIVTIMDARARLGHLPAGPGPDSRIIVVQRGGETLGFAVDRVLRVVRVEASDIEPQPVVHASEEREPIRGVFRHVNSLTILLDLDKLLA